MFSSNLPSFRQSAASIPVSPNRFLAGILIGVLLASTPAFAADSEQRRLRIAFEISSDSAFAAFVANVEGLQKNFGELADISVIACSRGAGLLRAGNPLEARLAKLADQGVDFVVGSEGLAEVEMSPSDLVPFARTVRSGYQEIKQLQEQGWAWVGDGESYVSHL